MSSLSAEARRLASPIDITSMEDIELHRSNLRSWGFFETESGNFSVFQADFDLFNANGTAERIVASSVSKTHPALARDLGSHILIPVLGYSFTGRPEDETTIDTSATWMMTDKPEAGEVAEEQFYVPGRSIEYEVEATQEIGISFPLGDARDIAEGLRLAEEVAALTIANKVLYRPPQEYRPN